MRSIDKKSHRSKVSKINQLSVQNKERSNNFIEGHGKETDIPASSKITKKIHYDYSDIF